MKHLTFISLLLFNSIVSADLATFRDGLLIDPGTDEPFTGNIELINDEWDAVEFSQHYVDGLLHGKEFVFYQSGRLKSIGTYKSGLIDGITKVFYEDGSLMIIMQAKNNLREGRHVSFYPSGQPQVEKFYQNDKIHGLERTWFKNGNPMSTKHYHEGVLVGQVSTYYEDSGRLFERSRVIDGKPTNTQFYKEDGSRYDEDFSTIMLGIIKAKTNNIQD